MQPVKQFAIGEKHNRLTVIGASTGSRPNFGAMWPCRCDCGKEVLAGGSFLRTGKTKSCGCLGIEVRRRASTKHGHATKAAKSATYSIWRGILARCLNKNAVNYHHYGGKGIAVAPRWMEFQNFLNDMGERPRKLSIDRIDGNKGYEPGNCRWVTQKAQVRNRSVTKTVMFQGRERPLAELVEGSGLSYQTVHLRLKNGWDIEKAIGTPTSRKSSAQQRTLNF